MIEEGEKSVFEDSASFERIAYRRQRFEGIPDIVDADDLAVLRSYWLVPGDVGFTEDFGHSEKALSLEDRGDHRA